VKAELNCEIHNLTENAGKIQSSEHPSELKILDVASNIAVGETLATAVNLEALNGKER